MTSQRPTARKGQTKAQPGVLTPSAVQPPHPIAAPHQRTDSHTVCPHPQITVLQRWQLRHRGTALARTTQLVSYQVQRPMLWQPQGAAVSDAVKSRLRQRAGRRGRRGQDSELAAAHGSPGQGKQGSDDCSLRAGGGIPSPQNQEEEPPPLSFQGGGVSFLRRGSLLPGPSQAPLLQPSPNFLCPCGGGSSWAS